MSEAGPDPRRERTRPIELIGLAAVFAVFVGGGVMLFTRQWLLALEFFGVTFIISLVVLAMLMLAIGPKPPVPDEGDEAAAGEDDPTSSHS